MTIVTHDRALLFDDPVLCRVAETMWQRIPRHFPGVELDEWVVMPNHVHGILVLTDHPPLPATDPPQATDSPRGVTPGSLGAIVGNHKSVTARRINRVRHTPGAPVWQRTCYARVIRNERELAAIRQYIRDNPVHWAEDVENPNGPAP